MCSLCVCVCVCVCVVFAVVQSKLVVKNRANSDTSYISRPWFDMYLGDRRPIVLNSNPFIAFKEDPDLTDQVRGHIQHMGG